VLIIGGESFNSSHSLSETLIGIHSAIPAHLPDFLMPTNELAAQPSDQVLIAHTTCPDEIIGNRIAQTLVEERLAACVSQIPAVESVYFWDGRLQKDREILLIIKTTQATLAALESRLKALHPYELPELVAIRAMGGNDDYLNWVRTAVGRRARTND
jgi:periplasmic divalent cation tolerance protein